MIATQFFQLKMKSRLLLAAVLGALVLNFGLSILQDVEYNGEDMDSIPVPLKVFFHRAEWRKTPPLAELVAASELFPEGQASVKPQYIRQGAIYDCKFLATLASVMRTNGGRDSIFHSIEETAEGYMVRFPSEALVVTPLNSVEQSLGATTRVWSRPGIKSEPGAVRKNQNGAWLTVLEKAYGLYRNEHQDWYERWRRFVKHAIFEGRPTSQSELPSFGAAYGATDDGAMTLFTGKGVDQYSTLSFDCGNYGFGKGYVTWRQLKSWFDRPGVMAEFSAEQDRVLSSLAGNNRPAIATTELNGDCEAYGLNPGHAYAVIDYDQKRRRLTLLDPYGQGDLRRLGEKAALDGCDDGIFSIGLEDFNYLFSHLKVSR